MPLRSRTARLRYAASLAFVFGWMLIALYAAAAIGGVFADAIHAGRSASVAMVEMIAP